MASFAEKNLPTLSKLFSRGPKKAAEKPLPPGMPQRIVKKDSAFTTFSKAAFSVRLSMAEQTLFAKRLSFLIGAGVPLLESIHVLREQSRSRRMTRMFDVIINDVSNGQFLSSSLAKFRNTFGSFAINIIKVGEMSGVLTQNLTHLAEELRKKNLLRKKVVSALVYPIIVTVATLGVATLLTVYIFPKIMPIFSSLNVKLPWSTRLLLWVSTFLQHYGLWLLLGIVVFVVGMVIIRKTVPFIRMFLDRLLLRIPFVGRMALYYNMANLCRTLGLLLQSGMTISDGLIIVGDTMENRVYKKECVAISERVKHGEQISKYLLTQQKKFPHMMSHMISIGERTGNLSGTLIYLSDLYENELDDLTKNLSSAIEPVLMVTMGIVVGFVAISVITPIYEITQNLSH
jgi:type IV pilus assembly protein PilC